MELERSGHPESLIYVLVKRKGRQGAWPSQDKAAAS